MNLFPHTWTFTAASLRLKSNSYRINSHLAVLFCALALGFLGTSCNDSSNLNSSVFADDDLNIVVDRDFEIISKTEVRKPSLMFSNGLITPINHMIGRFDDPFFGKTVAETYSQVDFVETLGGNPFDGFEVDSIIITLAYDTSSLFGDLSQMTTFEVYEVEEFMDEAADYNSDDVFMSNTTSPLVSRTFTPAPYDSINIESGDTTVLVSPRLQLVVENADFKQRLIEADSALWADPDSFRTVFKGFHFAYSDMSSANSILGFNFRSEAVTQMRVEYFDPDSIEDRRNFIFTFGGDVNNNRSNVIRTNYFENDHSTGAIAQVLADSALNPTDSLMFYQEMQGLSPKITIKGLDKLKGAAINSAEITLTIKDLEEDEMLHLPEPNLITIEEVQGDSLFVDIIDTRLAKSEAASSNSLLGYVASIGGIRTSCPDTLQNKYIYTAAITSHLQDVIDKGQDETTIYISSFYQPDRPRRAIIFGSETKYPVELIVRYTKVL